MEATGASKRCFVVMGFGTKTDFETGRKLDLNKSYRLLIKPVVEEKNLLCIRADEIRHSGMIDVPMYSELLTADIVIADISTANPNALYELGLRHALAPQTTIVISENKLRYPFDLNHIIINKYIHLGDAIDYDEVVRFRKVLSSTLDAVLGEPKIDSPVYTFLQQLQPPRLPDSAPRQTMTGMAADTASLATLIEQGESALRADSFLEAKAIFAKALSLYKVKSGSGPIWNDPYLLQRLVLATYRAKQPTEIEALNEAKAQLDSLAPHESNDPETVGLAGDIEKGLFEQGQGDDHLVYAIAYYGRGFYLRTDVYNGIKLAHLLNVRADTTLESAPQETIADLVRANRIRKDVLEISERELAAIKERRDRASGRSDEFSMAQLTLDREHEFWCLTAMAEAFFGLGDMERYEKLRLDAEALRPPGWMMNTFEDQIGKLRRLLVKHGSLLTPPWPGAEHPRSQ
jgi:hypothetical protein